MGVQLSKEKNSKPNKKTRKTIKMKLTKYLIVGLAASVLMGSSASAQTVIRLVGSTAYRVSVSTAIINQLGAGATAAYVGSGAASLSGLIGASVAIYKNSTGTEIVKTFWTGSASGVTDVVTDTFNASGEFLGNSTPTAAIPGETVPSSDETDSTPPNLAMSDSFASSVAASVATAPTFSASVGGTTNGLALANKINASTITEAGQDGESVVGIVPFGWWAGYSTATSGISNITQEAANTLLQNGYTPVSFLTGNASDSVNFAYLIGRNEDSGTRIGALAESQDGFGNPPIQWQLTFSNNQTSDGSVQTGGAGSTVTFATEWPADSPLNTEPHINWNTTGHSGYISGGDVSNSLLATNPASNSEIDPSFALGENTGNSYFIGYLGWSDGYKISAAAHPGTELTYNGVTLSAHNIQTGVYTFYTYEHCYYVTSGSNAIGSAQSLADGIADAVFNTYAPTDSAGNTATANFPTSGAGVDANEDNLVSHDNAAPAGLLFDSSVLGIRGEEGAPQGLNY